MLVCTLRILDEGAEPSAHPPEGASCARACCSRQASPSGYLGSDDEREYTRGDFVYIADDGAQNRRLAQLISEFWWDEGAKASRILEKAPPSDIQGLGWSLIIPVRILYNAELAFIRNTQTELAVGSKIVVTTEHGNEIAQVLTRPQAIRNGETRENEVPLVRIVGEDDLALVKRNEEYSETAWTICREKIEKHKLPMNLVKTHALLEGNKILFFFTSEGRVDFRALAKDLASVFHTRIELRQIGVRDRSQLIGGCGVCGMILCCHSCKAMVQSVSIKMAKKQNLSLNSSKISGVCGKLLCCLSYEYATDENANKPYPRIGAKVWLGEERGVVKDVNEQTGIVRVMTDDQQYHDIPVGQIADKRCAAHPDKNTDMEQPQ